MLITFTLSDEQGRLLTYAAKASGASLESIAATLVLSGLEGYQMPMLQADAKEALKLQTAFNAAASTDTKATIATRLAAK